MEANIRFLTKNYPKKPGCYSPFISYSCYEACNSDEFLKKKKIVGHKLAYYMGRSRDLYLLILQHLSSQPNPTISRHDSLIMCVPSPPLLLIQIQDSRPPPTPIPHTTILLDIASSNSFLFLHQTGTVTFYARTGGTAVLG